MSDSLYDRYRDALRGGHLARLRGNHEIARRAYLEAAALLPDRAAPYVGLGRLELDADRPAEAAAAFETALTRSPNDVPALEGSAQALAALGRPADAADVLDRLAITLLEESREAEARDAIERALALAESRWRRRALERLGVPERPAEPWLGELPEEAADRSPAPARRPKGETATARRRDDEEAPPVDPELTALAAAVDAASAASDVPGLVRGALALARRDRIRAAIDACHDALSAAPADPAVHRALAAIYRRRGWDSAATMKLRLVERYVAVVDDPSALDEAADAAEAVADLEALLAVAARHADQGRHAAALEIGFRALRLAPADARVHLAIAGTQLALGWHDRVVDEIGRLWRLAELSGDDDARTRIGAFAADELAAVGSVLARTG